MVALNLMALTLARGNEKNSVQSPSSPHTTLLSHSLAWANLALASVILPSFRSLRASAASSLLLFKGSDYANSKKLGVAYNSRFLRDSGDSFSHNKRRLFITFAYLSRKNGSGIGPISAVQLGGS